MLLISINISSCLLSLAYHFFHAKQDDYETCYYSLLSSFSARAAFRSNVYCWFVYILSSSYLSPLFVYISSMLISSRRDLQYIYVSHLLPLCFNLLVFLLLEKKKYYRILLSLSFDKRTHSDLYFCLFHS